MSERNNEFVSARYGAGNAGRDYGRYMVDDPSISSSLTNGQSTGRGRRTGGYGGLAFQDPPSTSSLATEHSERRRQASSSRTRARDGENGVLWSSSREDGGRYGGSRERNRSDARDRSARGGGNQVEDVIRLIQDEWDFMAGEDCIPVQVALQLMDSSTLGRADREPDFLRSQKQIQKALKSIVNEHHQGFNSSIGTYHKIQSSIQSSQNRIRVLKSALTDAKGGLLTTKPELKGLATASQSYDDLLQLFGKIEHLQSLPEKLESRISEKRFIAAVEILQEALRLVQRTELDPIGGLGDLRTYLSNQESSLTDILIEELHDHLYLKSPYCQDRWKGPSSDESKGGPKALGANGVAPWEKPVYQFLSSLDVNTPLVDDASRNPESDTFYYIHLIIESLNKMGNLEVAVDRIEQRLPVELYAVVDKTSAEVDSRYPAHTRNVTSGIRNQGVGSDADGDRGYVLSEFLWNLYAKFEAIAEGHRVIHDVVTGIVEREGISNKASLTGGFKELWKLYESEMRYLLHDYLATDGESVFRSTTESGGVSSLSSVQRDKSKKLFKLSEVDKKSSDMKAEHDELDEILRSSVPGLVSKSRHKTSPNESGRSNRENTGTGHKLLIAPNVFNISLLLPPALSFIQRIKDIVPLTSDIVMSTLTSFLDNFMINVFQPQLDETVTDLCAMSFIATDAFTEDPRWSAYSSKPIFKGTVSFMNLVRTFSKMLDSIPHDQAFTQLVINQIVTYYEKCCGWYKALVSRVSPQHQGGVRLKSAAGYAESEDIRSVVKQLWEGPVAERDELINKEIDLLIKATTDKPLESYDVVSDPKAVFSLSLLYNSMQWLAIQLSRLRHITPIEADSNRSEARRTSETRRWTLVSATKPKRDSLSHPIHLPMTKESVAAFDRAIDSLRNLALTALLTLHIDIRCGSIHMVSQSLSSGNNSNSTRTSEAPPTSPIPATSDQNWVHILNTQPTTASPGILELNNDLIAFHATVSSYLGHTECVFLTSGLARLIDRAFVSATRFIGAMNSNGALRLQLDVLVLQQNLKNIITDAPVSKNGKQQQNSNATPTTTTNIIAINNTHDIVALPRSAKFLDYFLEGADRALSYAKEEKEAFQSMGRAKALQAGNGEPFTYDEMKVLVELCFSATLRGPGGDENREDFMAAKRRHGDALLKLSEIMWDS